MVAQERARDHHSPWIRTVEINSTFKIGDIPENSDKIDIWIPYPMETPYQEIIDVKIDFPYPYDLNRDQKYGNSMIYLTLSDPPAALELTMHYTIKRSENHGGVAGTEKAGDFQWALEPARLIPISPVVEDIARANTNPDDGNKKQAQSLYDHTISHMNYDKTGEGWGNGDWQYACDFRKGNCTDYHSYFIGLCRNIGIPAYFEIGYSIPAEKTEGEIPGYHCWAYFWDEEHWAPVDISEGDKHKERLSYYFGHHDPNRISLSRGRDIILTPPQQDGPLNYFVFPYAEVDGKKHDRIDPTLTFKQIAEL
jgi:transglutaminase-like putative cysteine protease